MTALVVVLTAGAATAQAPQQGTLVYTAWGDGDDTPLSVVVTDPAGRPSELGVPANGETVTRALDAGTYRVSVHEEGLEDEGEYAGLVVDIRPGGRAVVTAQLDGAGGVALSVRYEDAPAAGTGRPESITVPTRIETGAGGAAAGAGGGPVVLAALVAAYGLALRARRRARA